MARRKIEIGPIGPDVDLDVEDVRTRKGQRLTNELAEQIAEEALARHRGRPSVTGGRQRTPNLTVRVPPSVRDALEAIAQEQGRRLADISRDALTEYARRHTKAS